jgi:hypothetical protein
VTTRIRWTLVAAYVAALFALQPRLGFMVDAAKARWGEAAFAQGMLAVAVLGGLVFVALALRVWQRSGALDRALLVAVAALYVVGTALLDVPQERLHYLEYGLLAGLVYLAAQHQGMTRRRAALLALVLTTALGYFDEYLQGALWERRYFDWRDVQLNFQAAVLGTLAGLAVGGGSRRSP